MIQRDKKRPKGWVMVPVGVICDVCGVEEHGLGKPSVGHEAVVRPGGFSISERNTPENPVGDKHTFINEWVETGVADLCSKCSEAVRDFINERAKAIWKDTGVEAPGVRPPGEYGD